MLFDRWCARAQRSRLAPFIKAARTMRHRRDLILNAIEHGISNGRVEGLNTKVRLIVRRAYGFHSADAALALVMLGAGPIDLKLPHDDRPLRPPRDPHQGQESPEDLDVHRRRRQLGRERFGRWILRDAGNASEGREDGRCRLCQVALVGHPHHEGETAQREVRLDVQTRSCTCRGSVSGRVDRRRSASASRGW